LVKLNFTTVGPLGKIIFVTLWGNSPLAHFWKMSFQRQVFEYFCIFFGGTNELRRKRTSAWNQLQHLIILTAHSLQTSWKELFTFCAAPLLASCAQCVRSFGWVVSIAVKLSSHQSCCLAAERSTCVSVYTNSLLLWCNLD